MWQDDTLFGKVIKWLDRGKLGREKKALDRPDRVLYVYLVD
jgi:hypothetical protein